MLGEPVTLKLACGVACVAAGMWLATALGDARKPDAATSPGAQKQA